MKGIRKLFLGLVLLTLFGVGFKVDVKADVTSTYPITVPDNIDYTATGDGITGTLNVSYDALADITPTTSGQFVLFKVQLQSGTTADTKVGETKYICLKNDGGNPYYNVNADPDVARTGTGTQVTAASGTLPFSVTATRAQIVDKVGSGTAAYSVKLYVTKEDGTANIEGIAGSTATAIVLTKEVTASISPAAVTGRNIVAPVSVHLLPGQTHDFVLNVTSTNIPYKLNTWVLDSTEHLQNLGASATLPTIHQNVKLIPGGTGNTTVTASFVTGGITVTWPTGSVSPGNTVTPSFSFTGYTTDDIYNSGVYVDSVSDANKITYTLSELNAAKTQGNLQFTVPGLSNGTHKLLFTMSDGNVLESSNFTVSDTSTLSWRSTSALSDGVAVTNGKSIYIKHFLDTGKLKYGTAALSSPASDYASITAASPNVIGNAQLNGTKAMTGDSGKKDKITLTPTSGSALEGKVTVYPHISIATTSSSGSDDSLNSGSSSSNSKDTPLKITSPTYVYYGDTDYKVNKLKLKFTGPSGSESRTLDGPSSDSSTSNLSWSASVDSVKLSKILKEVCDSSSNDVTLTVYPYNGDTADENMAKTAELRVYKINLDGGGGAKYTINGEDMGDYFYAVKGARYTVKAQPKVNGDKFLNWDNNVFSSETGGDFTASESRTFRANYQSSSSSSGRSTALNGEGSGGSGDDYDDVPKTGESKTDIWILWSVLFISILGAGFMIWKRFGLARAIAEADAQVAHAEYEEQVKAAEKEKKDKLNMLKDLRNL